MLDVRLAETFAAGHVPGASTSPFRQRLRTKAGFVLRPGERIVLHAGSPEEAELAARRLHAVGFFELEGTSSEPQATETLEPVSVDDLDELLASDRIDLIDVRELDERDSGYIPGSRHIPYRLLAHTAPRSRAGGRS